MSLKVKAKRQSIAQIALVMVIGLPAGAQPVGAVRGWFSTPSCIPVGATEPDGGGGAEASDGRVEPPSLAERAGAIAESLPAGRARDLAQDLTRRLSPRSHLKYVCKDETETGYVIRYPEGLGTDFASDTEFVEYPYEVFNLGRPEIEFNIEAVPSEGVFIYSYHLSNAIGATRPISTWTFVAEVADRSLRLERLTNWNNHVPNDGSPVALQAALYADLSGPELRRREPPGKLPVWVGLGDVIDPGETVRNFTVTSKFRPGWTTAYVSSEGENFALPFSLGEFPEAVQEEILFLHRWENSHSSVPIIGPRFSADARREAIAANWQAGIRTLIAHGWLMGDSPYVGELLQFLEAPSPVDMGAIIRSEPQRGMEALLDEIVRMAF